MALFNINYGGSEIGNTRKLGSFNDKEGMISYAKSLFEDVKNGFIEYASINDVYKAINGSIGQGSCLVYVDRNGVRECENITSYHFRSDSEKLDY